MLFITIEYWKTNLTYFHLGKKWNISESYCYRIVARIEKYLIESSEFSLPEIKDEDVVIVDSSEISIQRPKKTEKILLRQE